MHWPAATVSWLENQWRHRGTWYWLTLPLTWCYATVAGLRAWLYRQGLRKPCPIPVPVIVVGNLYVGGTGKTPITIELANLLTAHGWHPGLVSRGYGTQSQRQPATGRGSHLSWKTFGDEPALIASLTAMPISVHPDRCTAARHLLDFDPSVDIILSDDGLQHYRLHRDLEILVEDDRGIGNGATLPAGPLRESPKRGQRVDGIFKRGAIPLVKTYQLSPPNFHFDVTLQFFTCPATGVTLDIKAMAQHISAIKTSPPTPHDSADARVIAMAGIGVPARFFNALQSNHIPVDQTIALADHQALSPKQLESLDAATILMTAKDAVKCMPIEDPRIWVAQVSVDWGNEDPSTWLLQKLREIQAQASQPSKAIN